MAAGKRDQLRTTRQMNEYRLFTAWGQKRCLAGRATTTETEVPAQDALARLKTAFAWEDEDSITARQTGLTPVSYTHLTLPTIHLV